MKNNLTLKQRAILKLLESKSMTRHELGLLAIKSARRDLRFLERQGLVKSQEKYSNNSKKNKSGTRYYIYSLI